MVLPANAKMSSIQPDNVNADITGTFKTLTVLHNLGIVEIDAQLLAFLAKASDDPIIIGLLVRALGNPTQK